MKKRHYNAIDGLNLLSYLGLELNVVETHLFKRKWETFYRIPQDLILTTNWIYAFELTENVDLSAAREHAFKKKIANSGVEYMLKHGTSLDELLFTLDSREPKRNILDH